MIMDSLKLETEKSSFVDVTINAEPVKLSYEDKVANCTVIAKPMASKKLARKCYKLVKKSRNHKKFISWGLHDVQKGIRKGETGLVVFAGDVTPINVMCHLPIVCEEKSIPYVFVPSRKDLGTALGVKRGCVTVFIRYNENYGDSFNELKEEISHLPIAF